MTSNEGPDLDRLSSWQFALPPELIASRPVPERDGARMLIVNRRDGSLQHSTIRDLPNHLHSGDLLVFNNTRVLPARLHGVRTATGGRWNGLFTAAQHDGTWSLLVETRGRLQPGETLTVHSAEEASAPSDRLVLTLLQRLPDGGWQVRPDSAAPPYELLEQFGSLPLPPYIRRDQADAEDRLRYQTEFASKPGAIAAPTAGLHFSSDLLHQCRQRGADTAEITLHVGVGTFRPVTAERLSQHRLHAEWAMLPESVCRQIAATRTANGRVIAVGTTSVRTLETAARSPDWPAPWQGPTDLFIRPGFDFLAVNALLTNFHLPGSTLLALVAALAGYELIMRAYHEAITARYRFFSYGDAMLIV
jgi:S-adenosylmethionine:tRNA ribosyltransferase-isomerase